MRCPRCSHNQKYRNGMTCAKCRYRFVLNPKLPPRCSDRGFAHHVATVSDNGNRAYTVNQLHAAIYRGRNRFIGRWVPPSGADDFRSTASAFGSWRAHGKVSVGKLVEQPVLESAPTTTQAAWPEPDLYDYGAEGILVVDDRLAVDLLVGIGLHTMAKVVVVDALHQYPAPVVERAKDLVASRPDIPVFLLHASQPGMGDQLEERAREVLGARLSPVTDLGLPPDAASRIAGLRWAKRVRPITVDMLAHAVLLEGVTAAMRTGLTLDELMHPPKKKDREAVAEDRGILDFLVWEAWGDLDIDFG